MSLFPEGNSNVLFPPVVGEKLIVTLIGEIKRVKNNNEEGNYKDKSYKNLGYYDLVPVLLEDGTEDNMKMNAWKLYFALKKAYTANEIKEGDTIEINHANAKEYIITKK